MALSNPQRFNLITAISPIIITLLLCFTQMANASTDHATHHANHHANQHAPIGVMGDHMHKRGEWMFSYRRMTMTMEDNIQGSDSISNANILTNPSYRVIPSKMTTTMDMFGAMYAPSEKVTLMLMVNYLDKKMRSTTYDMMNSNKGNFSTHVSGLGDTKLSALYSLYKGSENHLHLNLGISIPTGDIDKTDKILMPMPMMGQNLVNKRLPYPMQLGSGTYDLEPGITYNGQSDWFKWGGQIKAAFRLDDNDKGYTLGDQVSASSWASYRVNAWLATAVRLTYTDSKAIDGQDAQINALMTQSAKANNFGGDRLDLSIGVTLLGTKPEHRGHQIGIEYTTTIDQEANGIQMEMQDMLNIGYQYTL
ncbi:MAG: transporter [Pseudomonadales bacterium]|nr:transporter [Pseudomonadales bacterium]